MKTLITFLALLISQVAFAKITNSNYEARHLKLIEESISQECGYFFKLTQLDSTAAIIQIDQGIRDVVYTTTIEGIDRIDQGVFDYYDIKIVSEFADMYDHANQNWGVYSVKSVKCQML